MPLSDDEREKLGRMLRRFNEVDKDKPRKEKMTKARAAEPKSQNFSEAMMKRLRVENEEIMRDSTLVRGGENCCPNDRCKKRDGVAILNIRANKEKDIPEHIGLAMFNEHAEEANVVFIGLEQAKELVNQLMMGIAKGEQAAGITFDPLKKADC